MSCLGHGSRLKECVPVADICLMSAKEASAQGVGLDQAPAPPAPMSELREDVHPLGEALKARAADVLDLTARANHRTGPRCRRRGSGPLRANQQELHDGGSPVDRRGGCGGGHRGRQGNLGHLRRAGGPPRGVAEPADETVRVVARLGGRGAAAERRATGRFARGALPSPEHPAAESRVQPCKDVQVL